MKLQEMTLSKVAIVVRKVWTCWSVWIRTVETDHLLLLKDFLCLLGWQGFSECCSSYELLCIVVWLVRCRWAEASTTSFYILWTWPWSSALYLIFMVSVANGLERLPLRNASSVFATKSPQCCYFSFTIYLEADWKGWSLLWEEEES